MVTIYRMTFSKWANNIGKSTPYKGTESKKFCFQSVSHIHEMVFFFLANTKALQYEVVLVAFALSPRWFLDAEARRDMAVL